LEPDTNSLLDDLVSLGLTKTQALVYLVVLRVGAVTARQVSKEANVSLRVAYKTIKELTEMSFLEVRLGLPNKYGAVQPDEALRRLAGKLEADTKSKVNLIGMIGEGLMTLANQSSRGPQNAAPGDPTYRVIRGRDRLFDESQHLRKQTRHELLLILPALGLRRLVRHGYAQEVGECVRRGVDVRIITEITGSNVIESSTLASLVSLRHYPSVSFRLGVYDREKFHIGAAYDDDPASDGSNDIYLLISDPAMARSMVVLFEAVWEKSHRADVVLKRLEIQYPRSRSA
jgi:sugar-specific transcriptional regulator TrmB